MKMYVARDEGMNHCKLFHHKPEKVYDKNLKMYLWRGNFWDGQMIGNIPEVTFENSPMEVELKLIEK